MAVVKTGTMRSQATGNKDWKYVVKFTVARQLHQDDLFSIDLPELVQKALAISSVKGKTLHEVEQVFRDTIERFYNLKLFSRKVICWKVETQATIYRGVGTDRHFIQRTETHGWSSGICLSIAASVAIENARTQPDGSILYEYVPIEDDPLPKAGKESASGYGVFPHRVGPKADHVMDWTESREKWFLRVMTGLEELVLQVTAITDEDQKLLDFIEAGHLLAELHNNQ